MSEDLSHRRLPNWEQYDEISMKVVPRFKQSELSGDEWRTSILIEFFHKCTRVKVESARNMHIASMLLGSMLLNDFDNSMESILPIESTHCDQPGCNKLDNSRFTIGKLVDNEGQWLDMSEQHGTYYQQFCTTHSTRGDSDREDCDGNLIEIPFKESQ